MEKKLVSIVIPMYNAEDYIGKTIESLLIQDYENIEILVVDDGSKDHSLENAKKYEQIDSRVKVYHKENGGVSETRNYGIQCSKGFYIMFLDSDDYMEKNAISYMVSRCEAEDADSVVASRYEDYVDEGRVDTYCIKDAVYEIKSEKDRLVFLAKHYLQNDIFCEVWNRLYKSDIVKNNQIIFSKDLKVGEDKLFNLIYLLYVNKIVASSEKLYHYRIYSNSTMGDDRNSFHKHGKHYFKMCEEFYSYLKSHFSNGYVYGKVHLLLSGMMHQVYYQLDDNHFFEYAKKNRGESGETNFINWYNKLSWNDRIEILRLYNLDHSGKEKMGYDIAKESYLSGKLNNKISYMFGLYYFKVWKKLNEKRY